MCLSSGSRRCIQSQQRLPGAFHDTSALWSPFWETVTSEGGEGAGDGKEGGREGRGEGGRKEGRGREGGEGERESKKHSLQVLVCTQV